MGDLKKGLRRGIRIYGDTTTTKRAKDSLIPTDISFFIRKEKSSKRIV